MASPGAKILKKALSLKMELRDKIIGRQPSSSTPNQANPDGCFSKQHQYNTPVRKAVNSTDRLHIGVAKVGQALMYASDVVQKKTLSMLPGTTTIVLETVQDLLQTLHYYYHTADGEEYSAQCADLYGAIAELMKLSDAHVLHSDRTLESKKILATIRSIKDIITLLTSNCIEKTEEVFVLTPTSGRPRDASNSLMNTGGTGSEGELSKDNASLPPSKPSLPDDYEVQLAKLNISPCQPRDPSPEPPSLPQKRGISIRSVTSPELDQPDHPKISLDDDSNQNRTMVASPSWPGSRSHSREPSPMDILEKMRSEMKNDIDATLTTMRSASSTQRASNFQSGIVSSNTCTDLIVMNDQSVNQMISEAANTFINQTLSLANSSSASSAVTTTSVQTYNFQHQMIKSGGGMEHIQSQTSSQVFARMGRADVNASYVQSYLNDFAGKKDAYLLRMDVEGENVENDFSGRGLEITRHDLSRTVDEGQIIEGGDEPPPLPLKKKNVDIYMLAFGGVPTMLDFAQSHTNFQDFYRERFEKQQMELALDNSAELIYDNAAAIDLGPYGDKPPSERRLPADDCKTPYLQENYEVQALQNTESHEEMSADEEVLIGTDVWSHITCDEKNEIECVKSGCVDALVALVASASSKEFLYQEAFLTTYLTFIHAGDLIDKLLRRYSHFSGNTMASSKRYCRSTFSLLIRVVDEMGALIGDEVLDDLFYLVFCLISDGELILAKCLRKTVLNKCKMKQKLLEAKRNIALLPSIQLTLRMTTLLDLKAHVIAEQMTLIDNEIFQNIEISELLRYSREQREELSPNLTKFTEHFNKVSFWCRSRIMEIGDQKDREKFMIKFQKIMKHLRKLKNFHSYLALLSAVDSAPVRRLEWSKQLLENSAELSDIMDSSSSFRKYRNTLTETQPPCIPYIGLILQDLTFVHIGNPDITCNGEVNFTKRWQLFHILEGLRRYKKQCYDIKRDANVIMFFNGFDDHLSEEVLWQLSEDYKPRKSSNKNNNR